MGKIDIPIQKGRHTIGTLRLDAIGRKTSGNYCKISKYLLLHARLNRKFFYYAVKYAQYIHGVIPVKNLNDKKGFPTTPFFLATNRKPSTMHFRTFG